MKKVFTEGSYRLTIENDNDALNTRTQFDNAGKMFCWSNQYALGDDHSYQGPFDLLTTLIEVIPEYKRVELLTPIAHSYASNIVIKNYPDGTWGLFNHDTQYRLGDVHFQTTEEALEARENYINQFIEEEWKSHLSERDMLDLIQTSGYVTILPIYMYDHGDISIKTTPFSCYWDSGRVGYTYMTKSSADRQGIKNPESILEAEVQEYNHYLTGNVWGFTLELVNTCPCCEQEKAEIIDSSWGYYGDIKDNGLIDNLPDILKGKVEEEMA